MTQITFEHVSTNKYGHRIDAYTTKKMRGYIVTVKADGVESRYDFLDSFELALEYREALDKSFELWSKEVARAENLYEATGNESAFKSAGEMWGGYMVLAHDAIYPRWTLCEVVEEQPEPVEDMRCIVTAYDLERFLLDDLQATYDDAAGRGGYG